MSVFQPEQILVQNPDMAQWLKMELAEQHGIAANLEFPLPSAFLWQVFKALFPGLPEESPFAKDRIVWQLMQLLPTFMSRKEFSWVERYLGDSEGDERTWRLYQLCTGIADIFDQYLMYRPDWMANWEAGEPGAEVPLEHQWQPILWQAVADAISEASGTRLHRGRLLQEAIERLDQEEALAGLALMPRRICLFGISALPEQTLLLLNGLGKHLDLHWFQVNPCGEFWLDIVDPRSLARLKADKRYIHLDDLGEARYFLVGNPLLAAMGGLGREHLSMMYEKLEGELYEDYPGVPGLGDLSLPEVAVQGGALAVLQSEIHQLSCRGQFEELSADQLNSNRGKLAFTPEQLSNVQLHACYSPMREVEVLKDQLLQLFEQDPDLTPNDVMVMMSDVGIYAPYIHAVFSGVGDEQRFPYSINDLSAVQESPLIDSMLVLLDLPESRLRISEVLGILEVPAVMRRFGISTDELEQIKHWLNEVGVRWGRDDKHRQELGLGPFSENSWDFGLRRMLLGYAMHPEQGSFSDSLPYLEIEGSDTIALGKLMMFIDCLDDYRTRLQQSLPARQWPDFFAGFFADFYQADDMELAMLQRASSQITRLSESCYQVGYEDAMPRLIVREYLAQTLSSILSGRRFRAGAVNFCTLMPMRSIPFKVICLLGMSDGTFPRYNEPVSFDLMTAQRRRGDRSRRLDDRYLFLEAVLSCRSHLHISWIGRDIRDAGELPPSILISELNDYIREAWMLEGDASLPVEETAERIVESMRIEHPLQPFNSGYFRDDNSLFSYSRFWADGLLPDSKRRVFAPGELTPREIPSQLELHQLESMLLNPCAAFMQRYLGVYFDPLEGSSSDSEPFDLNALDQWHLKNEAMEFKLRGEDLAGYKQKHRMTGSMPVGVAGDYIIDEAARASDSLVENLPPYLPRDRTPQELKVRIGNCWLHGAVPAEKEGRRWQIKIGKLSEKDRMRGWLRLLACAAGQGFSYFVIDQSHACCYQPLTPEQAQELLADYLDCYSQAMVMPLPFFLRCGFTLLYHPSDELDDELRQALNKVWLKDSNGRPGEGDDPYIRRCYPDWESMFQSLSDWSTRLLTPLQDNSRRYELRGGKVSDRITHHALFKELASEAK